MAYGFKKQPVTFQAKFPVTVINVEEIDINEFFNKLPETKIKLFV